MSDDRAATDFRHEAILYRGESQFLERIVPFVRDGVAAGEPTLVMVNHRKIHALREIIGADGDGLVEYRDMEFVGANPARIIPAWKAFSVAGAHRDAVRMRGVGEPIWPGRAAAQLEECHWHEALINRAFARLQGFWLICPYDIASLDPSVLIDARYTHPVVTDGMAIDSYSAEGARQEFVVPMAPLASPLPPPDGVVAEVAFDASTLGEVRALVAVEGAQAGLLPSRLDDLILAVSEVATNSVVHGGGRGLARLWVDDGDVVCEVSDRGVIIDPLVDRQSPGSDPSEPRGLWAANQLCDLVQVRSSRESGSVVRLLVHAGRRAA